MKRVLIFILLISLMIFALIFPNEAEEMSAQNASEISKLIKKYKEDTKGPFEAIRWFCPDGTLVAPPNKCAQQGGFQRAIHKERVKEIQRNFSIYMGQILSGTSKQDFLDENNNYSRMKQYIIEQYLRSVDDGWILRKARFYRGAYQSEDEDTWGYSFLEWLLSQKKYLTSKFFLCREAVKTIPHRHMDKSLEIIRDLSRDISDAMPSFMDLRTKIHGHPDTGDYERVRQFYEKNRSKVPKELIKKFEYLQKELKNAFSDSSIEKLNIYQKKIPKDSPLLNKLNSLINNQSLTVMQECWHIADLLSLLRHEMIISGHGKNVLSMMDLSVDLEMILFRKISEWQNGTLKELLLKSYLLAMSSFGCGFLESHEWEAVRLELVIPASDDDAMNFEIFDKQFELYRRMTEWCSGMTRAEYGDVVITFSSFEALSAGFIDNCIRSSILLHFGDIVGSMSNYHAHKAGTKNYVMGLGKQNQIRGLNPGYTKGRLNVFADNIINTQFNPSDIYILHYPPADLKPIGGIATVTEGNLLSHVQLLARNIGIPNAVLSQSLLSDLKDYSGKDIFYAVSPGGAVLMKLSGEMTDNEKMLFVKQKEHSNKIEVPVDKIDIREKNLIPLRSLRSSHSGKICGPKAANLGQLGAMYPDNVSPGFVIPFGIFFEHMQQKMPQAEKIYWQFLTETLKNTGSIIDDEAMIIEKLTKLRFLIKNIPLLSVFVLKLERAFKEVFNMPLGKVPVFIRSDTNVEDLKDFTGAGLNLTAPNILKGSDIIQAIRDVWASPYTERSYKWRQRFLKNPQHVYPSILILKSINCDSSGVIITTGMHSKNLKHITVSFNRGVGGAVDGQAAEVYEVFSEGSSMISPSREPYYKILPDSGGIKKVQTTFNRKILDDKQLKQLFRLSQDLRSALPGTPGIESEGPYDIELGFKDNKIWLFQVRPFVENRAARSSEYLRSLDSEYPKNQVIPLEEKTKKNAGIFDNSCLLRKLWPF